jgi:hypothetical protein
MESVICPPLQDNSQSVHPRACGPQQEAECAVSSSRFLSVVPGPFFLPAPASEPPAASLPATLHPSEITASRYFLQGHFAR